MTGKRRSVQAGPPQLRAVCEGSPAKQRSQRGQRHGGGKALGELGDEEGMDQSRATRRDVEEDAVDSCRNQNTRGLNARLGCIWRALGNQGGF